ncbi:MAG: helix-turn-helix transcriptional regulator [Ruminococcaceae bacterium]|nr:helix-turn-helix transcriptional regulator [Oscillospiraceae bacterium]
MYECKIAEKLVELRNARGVTQEDVAQSLSISNKTVSKWENGASMPDLSMLVELSKYYGVTTDTLLGLTEDKKQSTAEEIRSLFEGLNRRKSVLKSFEAVKSLVPTMYGIVSKYYDDVYDEEDVIPAEKSRGYRSEISHHEFFEFTASSENVNLAVMMLKNKANFAWLNDTNKQKEIVKIFKFLSNEDALSVLYFVHSTACSESFTADYIATNTGIEEKRVTEILDEFCSVGECNRITAHLTEGEVIIYESSGDGIILSLITIAFEKMCGSKSYDFYYNANNKMIGGK